MRGSDDICSKIELIPEDYTRRRVRGDIKKMRSLFLVVYISKAHGDQ